jgi:hypothetical protein
VNIHLFTKHNYKLLVRVEDSCLIYVICVCLCILMSNTYCAVFLFCLSSSCVLYIASISRLSILIAPSVLLRVIE